MKLKECRRKLAIRHKKENIFPRFPDRKKNISKTGTGLGQVGRCFSRNKTIHVFQVFQENLSNRTIFQVF